MKKKHLGIIVSQSVVIILLCAYSFYQRTIAHAAQLKTISAMESALNYRHEAERARDEADKQRKIAELHLVNAMAQLSKASDLPRK
jgi:hypothetical protein